MQRVIDIKGVVKMGALHDKYLIPTCYDIRHQTRVLAETQERMETDFT